MRIADVKYGSKYRTNLLQPGFKRRRETIVTAIALGNVPGKSEAQVAVSYQAAAAATGLGIAIVSARSLTPVEQP